MRSAIVSMPGHEIRQRPQPVSFFTEPPSGRTKHQAPGSIPTAHRALQTASELAAAARQPLPELASLSTPMALAPCVICHRWVGIVWSTQVQEIH